MMKRWGCLLLLVSAAFSPQCSARPVEAVADTVPFSIGADKRMYVTVFLNGNNSRPFRFLIDTGATDIVLNASLEKVTGNAVFDRTTDNTGASSTETIPCTDGSQTIQVGKSRLKGVRFIAIHYPPAAWDGVLGLSFLKNYDVAFNYDRKEMYVFPRGTAPKPKSKGLDFKFISGVPVIAVSVTVKGKTYPVNVELDSGSDRVLDLNTPFVEANGLRGKLPVFAVSTISGTSQNTGKLENVVFDSATVGETSFPNLPGAFSTITVGLQATDSFDGVIGNNLLQRFNQQWDFVRNKVYLEVNHRYYTPFYDFLIAE